MDASTSNKENNEVYIQNNPSPEQLKIRKIEQNSDLNSNEGFLEKRLSLISE
jgi:hypothetical protein